MARERCEDRLPAHRLDDVADALVVEEEIEELRDREVVRRDGVLPFRCDEQISLDGSAEVDVPCGDAVHLASRQVRADCDGFTEIGSVQLRAAQVGIGQIDAAQTGGAQVDAGHSRA